ncbi:AbrB/MazE/SpoVT family DNA-binding domain-containing protein [Candidatus Woesearchaeota archaeon]|nr:AbrB/MazE/SpoVT family DNA-binding domain-containing protein [Candidatus Woesearchaeota archaeon]
MVGIMQKARVGPKGQVVIPKIFRENMGIVEGREVVLSYDSGKVVITNPSEPIDVVAERMARGRVIKLSPRQMREMAAEQT